MRTTLAVAVVVSDFVNKGSPLFTAEDYPALAALAIRCEELPAFQSNPFPAG